MSGPFLDREEYIEQAYFFRTYRERLEDNFPSQEILDSVHEEVLATTKLPMAIEFLRGEIMLTGRISDGMARLSHYFTPFQRFVLAQSEEEKSRFDQKIALQVLEREAEYLAGSPVAPALFIYQFECVARNRLGYDDGLKAIAADPFYDDDWREWIHRIRPQLGAADFADLIFYRSQHYVTRRRRRTGNDDYRPSWPILFDEQAGRIARANKGKDPLYMFGALQRQLGYPSVPRAKPKEKPDIPPAVEQRLQKLEKRIKLLESEMKGGLDLSQFYADPPNFSDDEDR